MSHSHVACVDEYLSLISQYDHFEKLVPCDVITEIMKEIFEIFTPGDFHLNDEELNEILEIYFTWILENNYDGCDVPFDAFE
eukprot:gene36505-45018_t